ncbi:MULTISPECIES: helix-turn-helix transcriptional regulator [unclassified Plantactinospora]|uniref:helix-turn-helix transcriptional regulator n=1 Tax=unclassified Plantactinospora TaxID=2631981 RepID=UPI001F473C3C|nr:MULTISPECIES: helix-turn-helix transcriptional regulator [unclassified Plantactinospora]
MTGRGTGALAVGRAVPLLVRWGVSADADLVYRCLVTFGSRSTGDIAASLGLAARRVREALDELAEADLVAPSAAPSGSGADAVTWRAVAAELAVATLRRRALRRAAPPVEGPAGLLRPGMVRPFPARRLPDREATRRRIAELVALERVEHLAMNPEEIFDTEALAIGAPLDIALLRRRIRLRSLGRAPADGDRSSRHATEFARLGGEYRETSRLPHKLMIFDRRVALVAVDPYGLHHGTWEVVEPAAVESFVSLFVRYWTEATDPRRNGVPEVVLTPREKALVALLAEGHTDSSAAKELGMSTRSVTYALRSLMDRLGVENRFQLGLALGAMQAASPPRNRPPVEGEDR